MSSPLLSIGMIVKDEIRCIERCLQSLEPLRKEIPFQLVVADTGSTDGTREVVEKYADIVFDFSWVNDFAAARNAVLDRCTGEWFLAIDADEWLEDVSPLIDFLTGKAQEKYNGAMCIVRNYADVSLSSYGDFFVDRMRRRRGGKLRYQYPIHETMYYSDGLAGSATVLPQLILHHDGYMNAASQQMKEKRHRNMLFLREEVKKKPKDLRILVHALQSAEDSEEMQEYIGQALELAPSQRKDAYSSIAYQNSSQFFFKRGEYRKTIDCYNRWKKLWPSSPVLEVDGEAVAAAAEYSLGHDEEALEHIRRWKWGMRRVRQGKDLDSADRLITQYYMDGDDWKGKLACIEIQSLLRLKRYEAANQAIQEIDLHPVAANNRVALLKLVFDDADNLLSSGILLEKCWALCIPQDKENEDKDEKNKYLAWKNVFFKVIKRWMQKDQSKAVSLLCKLDDCVLGLSARIIKSYDADEIAGLWEKVSDWEDVLPQAYFHTMELGLPFPDSFYHQKPGFLQEVAASIASNIPNFAFHAAKQSWLEADTLVKLQFQYDLSVAALQKLAPLRAADEKALCQTLCDRFTGIAQELLPELYATAVLQSHEDWAALFGMHQFGLWMCAAAERKNAGDMAGYIRALRRGLQQAPAMKDMVEFLLDQAKVEMAKQQATPEMLQLAERVRVILAQYPPDDPAVIQLKASPAYQRVAYLVESGDDTVQEKWGEHSALEQ